jgi:DNA-binding transcriptional regulator YdaS (Cro superfamily)
MEKRNVADDKPHVAALKRAIAIAGSQVALADGLASYLKRPTIRQQTISYWLLNETLLDAEYWPAFEHVTGGVVTRVHLRPEVFELSQIASEARV